MNTITEFSKTRIKNAITYIIYSILCLIPFMFIFIFLLESILTINTNQAVSFLGLLYVLIFFVFFLIGLLVSIIIVYTIKIIRNAKTIHYYKNNKINIVNRIMIPYDYKLWLTAPKNTYHSISFKLTQDDDVTHITPKIFYLFIKFYNKSIFCATFYRIFNTTL